MIISYGFVNKVYTLCLHYNNTIGVYTLSILFWTNGGKIMPSTKPIIAVRTTEEIIEKMKFIAEENGRSVSKEVEMIIKKHIKRYEEDNGKIKIEE